MGRRTRWLLAAAGAAGAVALATRALRQEAIEPPLGRPVETTAWRGFDVAVTEAGDPADPDLVLLHGPNAAASSHEFARVVDELAAEFHVLAPDLPGFGLSARPRLQYDGEQYVRFVGDFLRREADDPVVVASSLSGAYAAAAVDRGAPARELALVSPTARAASRRRAWLKWLLRSPLVGEALFYLLVSRPAVRYFLRDHAFADPASVTDEWVEYDHATAHQPGARFAPASFVAGALDLEVDLAATLAGLSVPTTLLWGEAASTPTVEEGEALADRAGVPFVRLADANLLPHAERPEAFLAALREHVAAASAEARTP